ncbi:unnamed protein product [Strongylus vulgaris]|uniref:Uncharacterized protein n=1 Tax=Strongylus vulgaris TaxID=40348 RepID=A0A3P7J2N5_STRVU|nr:unnamed protein product [Strongylus vulgaris]
MNSQLILLLAFLPALLAQLYGIANPGLVPYGASAACNGYLRFAARAGIRPSGLGYGALGPYGCPCPGASTGALPYNPYNPYGSTTGVQNVILNACVPACCPTIGKK